MPKPIPTPTPTSMLFHWLDFFSHWLLQKCRCYPSHSPNKTDANSWDKKGLGHHFFTGCFKIALLWPICEPEVLKNVLSLKKWRQKFEVNTVTASVAWWWFSFVFYLWSVGMKLRPNLKSPVRIRVKILCIERKTIRAKSFWIESFWRNFFGN